MELSKYNTRYEMVIARHILRFHILAAFLIICWFFYSDYELFKLKRFRL